MFRALIGDLFASQTQTLVNTVNCVGIMGKGVAEQFKKRFPSMFEDYQSRCAAKAVHLGQPFLYRDLSGVSIVNFPTKDHWRSPSRTLVISSAGWTTSQHMLLNGELKVSRCHRLAAVMAVWNGQRSGH